MPLIRQAVRLAEELFALSGPPAQALPAAAGLLARNHLSAEPLRELGQTVDLLRTAGLPEERLLVNLGFGRGLHYYTGMIFEIYSGADADDQPWCGGGRYDDLVAALGGRKRTPACGFAYHIGRLLDSLPVAAPAPCADILVAVADGELAGAALRIASSLRAAGWRVELDVRGRAGRANAQYAARCGIAYLLTLTGAGCRLQECQTGHSDMLDEAALLRWAAEERAGRRGEGR